MEKKGPYYITTAIAYAAGKPHIGNVYEIVLADAIARHKRLCGYEVRFQTGTDEHGQKVEERANAAGVTPKQFVDNVSKVIREQFDSYLDCFVPRLMCSTYSTGLYLLRFIKTRSCMPRRLWALPM